MRNIDENCYDNLSKNDKAPCPPRNLNSPQQTESSITLVWEVPEASANPIAYYILQPNYKKGIETTDLLFVDKEGLQPATQYTYFVFAVDNKGNRSYMSNLLYVKTK